MLYVKRFVYINALINNIIYCLYRGSRGHHLKLVNSNSYLHKFMLKILSIYLSGGKMAVEFFLFVIFIKIKPT